MKTILITLVLNLAIFSLHAQTQYTNLDKLPQQKRDSILMTLSKVTILKYGPGYYREYITPVITCMASVLAENKGRNFYIVTYYYDKNKESFSEKYIAKACIWFDSGKVFSVDFGNGLGVSAPDLLNVDDSAIKPITYQQSPRP